ncbi:hypothetical protein ACU686_09855 [Yinghuangia aomiensis]
MLALYTCTDALATPGTRTHLTALLDALGTSTVRNAVCLITKCAVPDDVVACITRNRHAGLPVLVYLSYSGLGPDIERGIDHAALRATFPRLHAAGVPVIHYWRPALPQNSSPDIIEDVMDWAARYAACTVAVGTEVKPTALDQITGLWPEAGRPAPGPASSRLRLAPHHLGLAPRPARPLHGPPHLPDQQLRPRLRARTRRPRGRPRHPDLPGGQPLPLRPT